MLAPKQKASYKVTQFQEKRPMRHWGLKSLCGLSTCGGIHTISEELFDVDSGFSCMAHETSRSSELPCFEIWKRSLTIQQNPGLSVAWSLIPKKGQTPLLDLWIMKPKMNMSEAVRSPGHGSSGGCRWRDPSSQVLDHVGLHEAEPRKVLHPTFRTSANESVRVQKILQEALPPGRPLSETLTNMIDKVPAEMRVTTLLEE